MRQMGLQGVVRGRKTITTVRDDESVRPPDLVDRQFVAQRPTELWVADFTYVATWSGFVYVAFVVEVFSRRIVGWRASTSMRTELVLDALEQALWARPRSQRLIQHSDCGSQGEFKRSLQHLDERGGCDGEAKTVESSRAGQVAFPGPPARRAARGATAFLVRDRCGALERGSGGKRSSITSGRGTMVPGGRGYAAIAPCVVGAAAVRALLVVRGAGADCSVARQGSRGSRDRAPAGAGRIDDLAGVAPQRCHTRWRLGVSGYDCAVACGSRRSAAEAGQAGD
jgi:hypothetical protein